MVSNACIDLVKEFEGFSEKAYLCPAGKWTIGYGITRYWSGFPVKPNDRITAYNALQELTAHLDAIEEDIKDSIDNVTFNENQLAALTSFVYNIGHAAFAVSAMVIYLHNEDWEKAADEFLKWKYITDPKTKKKVESAGLLKRRVKERVLFLKASN